jgi:hypothetical protein
MLSAISISRFACVEPRKAFTAVGTSLFRFVCINSRRLNSKVRHHSLLNANLKGNANIEAKIVLSATSKQMYRATPDVTRFFGVRAHISLQSMTHPRHNTFAGKPSPPWSSSPPLRVPCSMFNCTTVKYEVWKEGCISSSSCLGQTETNDHVSDMSALKLTPEESARRWGGGFAPEADRESWLGLSE